MMPFSDVVNLIIRNGMYSNKLHCNDYHGPPRVIGPQYVNLDDEREMATISMGGPSLYGGYLQTKVIISMNLGSDMVNLDLVFTQFHSIILCQDSRGHNGPSTYNRVSFEVINKAYPNQMDFWAPRDMDNLNDNNYMFFSQDSNVGIHFVDFTNK